MLCICNNNWADFPVFSRKDKFPKLVVINWTKHSNCCASQFRFTVLFKNHLTIQKVFCSLKTQDRSDTNVVCIYLCWTLFKKQNHSTVLFIHRYRYLVKSRICVNCFLACSRIMNVWPKKEGWKSYGPTIFVRN